MSWPRYKDWEPRVINRPMLGERNQSTCWRGERRWEATAHPWPNHHGRPCIPVSWIKSEQIKQHPLDSAPKDTESLPMLVPTFCRNILNPDLYWFLSKINLLGNCGNLGNIPSPTTPLPFFINKDSLKFLIFFMQKQFFVEQNFSLSSAPNKYFKTQYHLHLFTSGYHPSHGLTWWDDAGGHYYFMFLFWERCLSST